MQSNIKFTPHTQDELKKLNIQDEQIYTIEYLDKDYFNGDESLVKADAKSIINNGEISFIITDDYGMDKFIKNVKVIV